MKNIIVLIERLEASCYISEPVKNYLVNFLREVLDGHDILSGDAETIAMDLSFHQERQVSIDEWLLPKLSNDRMLALIVDVHLLNEICQSNISNRILLIVEEILKKTNISH